MYCTIEHEQDGSRSLRLGLNYVRGLKSEIAAALVETRIQNGNFCSVEDLTCRVPALNRGDLAQLARIGALNWLEGVDHRRDAVWQIEQISRPVGPLLKRVAEAEGPEISPLRRMHVEERLVADYSGTGLTSAHHPMAYRRAELRQMGILSASELRLHHDGANVCAAGAVIARQRPGTALGFIFLSMEDETGISNVIIHPELYEQDRRIVTSGKFLKVYGRLQNQDGVVHVKAERLEHLKVSSVVPQSHDFH